jgi:uncharacterized protein (TIGR03083 family)
MSQTRMPHTTAPTRVTPDSWAAVRTAVREAGHRFADLIRSVPDPAAPATKGWSIADIAAHVTGIAWNYTAFLAEDDRPLPIPEVAKAMETVTVDTIRTDLNPVQLRAYPERDPAALADRLCTSVAEVLSLTEDTDPARVVDWMGGARLPVAGVLAHMLNETLLHGLDIARAAGTRWPITDEQAVLFFDLFLVEIVRNGYGRLLDDDRPVRPGRIAVEFRSALTEPMTMVLESGLTTAHLPRANPDVRIRFRPVALNLLLFRRIGYARPVLSGSLAVSGRRPWLLAPFLRKLRMP